MVGPMTVTGKARWGHDPTGVATSGSGSYPTIGDELVVRYGGRSYLAEDVARGAAFELYSSAPEAGFLPNPRPGARYPYRRFVHATEVVAVESGSVPRDTPDGPLLVPLTRTLTFDHVHRLSQQAPRGGDPLLESIRGTVRVSRGSRMVKVLTGRQVAGYLRGGQLPHGFCYREYDIAHLRTPTDLRVLGDGADVSPAVAYAVRWRAVDPADYRVPSAAYLPGLVSMPPVDRIGPPVLGTGFAPCDAHLIPEYVTADLADLPLPAFAELLAYTADGTEVTLFSYLPEQRTWSRMAGPRWRHLLAEIPGITPDQEYFPVPAAGPTRLVGTAGGAEHEAVADPPTEFRILAKTRAARFAVQTLVRRQVRGLWRGVDCLVVGRDRGWLRLRVPRPGPALVADLGLSCVERGVYESWAPIADVTALTEVDTPYDV